MELLSSEAHTGGVLEYAAILAIRQGDMQGFERNVAQLQAFYGAGDSSAKKFELLGVNLLRLLALSHIAEFHTELELIPPQHRTSEPYIQYPIAMEQFLMEGAYHRAIESCGKTPSPLFDLFATMLGQTVRTQIAECFSTAYTTLNVADATKLMMLQSKWYLLCGLFFCLAEGGRQDPSELKQFEAKFKWVQANGVYDFSKVFFFWPAPRSPH